MANYSAFNSANGGNGFNFDTAGASWTGDIQLGYQFKITQSGYEIAGYYFWWNSTENPTVYDLCLWTIPSGQTNWSVVSGTDAAWSGTPVAGWNYVALATPFVPIVGQVYFIQMAQSGNFFWINNGLNAGKWPGGVINGPIDIFSDAAASGGTNPSPMSGTATNNGLFGETATTTATAAMPGQSYEAGVPGIDMLVQPVPSGGTVYTLWSQPTTGMPALSSDPTPYTMGTQFKVTLSGSQAATHSGVWFYSAPGAAVLPSQIGLYQTTSVGGLSGTLVHSETATWSGAAGSGWVRAGFASPPALTSGVPYKAVVYNGASSNFYAATANYWDTGAGQNGISNGVLSAPNYHGGDGGQSTFNSGTPMAYPTVNFNESNYWIDPEITVTGSAGGNTVTVTNPGSQSGVVGTSVSLQIHATDSATGQTLTYSATGLPTGLSIAGSTGLITGTPSAAGTYSVTVTATDTTSASGSATFSWTIATPSSPVITTTSLRQGSTNIAYSQTLAATGGTTPYTWSLSAGTLPTGLNLSSGGVISGTPTATGTSSFTVKVTDANSSTATQALSIQIVIIQVALISTSAPVTTYSTLSSLNNTGGAGAMAMRVLTPTAPSSAYEHAFLWMLPVEPSTATTQGTQYGDGIATAQTLNVHNLYNLTCIMPGFPIDPWYADSDIDATTQQETFMLNLVTWAGQNLATSGTEKHYLIGFSKSGVGSQQLFLRHPSIFQAVASWDFPGDATTYNAYDGAAVYGDQTNYANNYELDTANLTRWIAGTDLTTVNRIWIGAGISFDSNVANYNTTLNGLSIQHTDAVVAQSAHNWAPTPGWVGPALATLFNIPTVTESLSAVSEINVYQGMTLEATIEMNVGAPYQGQIRSLATDRWISMYPS